VSNLLGNQLDIFVDLFGTAFGIQGVQKKPPESKFFADA
jgi:hypothetical protein